MPRSETEQRVTISQASLPPFVSLGATSEELTHLLPKTGAEGIEILPFWGISTEVILHRKLRYPEVATSFHQTWKTDHITERRAGIDTGIANRVISTVSFPSREITDNVMKRLWQEYPNRPTVIHTLTDENTLGETNVRFYLELAHQNGVHLPDVVAWVGEQPERRGIVYPTRNDQFEEWKKKYATSPEYTGLDWHKMAKLLVENGNIASVHLGPLSTEDIKTGSDETMDRLKTLYQMGFAGDVVIEINPLKLQKIAGELIPGAKTFAYLKAVSGRVKTIRDR